MHGPDRASFDDQRKEQGRLEWNEEICEKFELLYAQRKNKRGRRPHGLGLTT